MTTLPKTLSMLIIVSLGCTSSAPGDAGARDAGSDAAVVNCAQDSECGEQSLFCARWRCRPGDPATDERGCVDLGPPCAACDEAMDACGRPAWCSDGREGCRLPGDCDGDNEAAPECGGFDCDDEDGNRYPGNTEVCDSENHDEDCDPTTFGEVDADGDGFVSNTCCNGTDCGPDCRDDQREIFPAARETCNAIDDDCDGFVDGISAFCPVGECVDQRCRGRGWEWALGSPVSDSAHDVVVDTSGNVFALVYFGAIADIDGDGLADDPPGYYVVSYMASGRFRWATQIPTEVFVLAADDEWIVAGGRSGFDTMVLEWIRPDDGSLSRTTRVTAPPSWDGILGAEIQWVDSQLFVALTTYRGSPFLPTETGGQVTRYDTTGAESARVLWSAAGQLVSLDTLGAGGGGVAISGFTSTSVVAAPGLSFNGRFVALLDQDLAVGWVTNGMPVTSTQHLAVSSDGHVAVAGAFRDTYAPFWGGPAWVGTDSDDIDRPDADSFTIGLSPSGEYLWSRVHDGPFRDTIWGVDFDDRNAVLVSGNFSGTLDGTPIGRPGATGEVDAFVAAFDVNDGFVLDLRTLAGAGRESVRASAVDRFGNLVVAGTFSDDITLPSGSTYSAAAGDLFVARFGDLL